MAPSECRLPLEGGVLTANPVTRGEEAERERVSEDCTGELFSESEARTLSAVSQVSEPPDVDCGSVKSCYNVSAGLRCR